MDKLYCRYCDGELEQGLKWMVCKVCRRVQKPDRKARVISARYRPVDQVTVTVHGGQKIFDAGIKVLKGENE